MQALERLPDTRVLARSSLYRSAPVGYLEQPDFINAVVEIETGTGAARLAAGTAGAGAGKRSHARIFRMRRARWIWMCCCMMICSITSMA